MSDPRNNEHAPRKQEATAEDPYARSTRQIDSHIASLFNTLWGLPAQIYQRGNEHGREFSRLMDERHQRHAQRDHESRGEREDEQEREDGRGSRACGWRGRDRWQHARERRYRMSAEQENETASEHRSEGEVAHEDWIKRIGREVERNTREAEKLYDEYETKILRAEEQEANAAMESLIRVASDLGLIDAPSNANRTVDADKTADRQQPWSEVFPAWAAAEKQDMDEHKSRDRGTHRPGPLVTTAQRVEEAMNQAAADFNALVHGTGDLAKILKEGYNREARMWDNDGLFGANMPFSGPLSAMFSLGMRPFMPQDSAIGYLLFSKYSPLHLEHEEGFDRSFRKRFEDLIRAQSGKEMGSHDGVTDSTKVEWLGRMSSLIEGQQQSGDEGDWTALCPRRVGARVDEYLTNAETEMDVYEQQLADQYAPSRELKQALATNESGAPAAPAASTSSDRVLCSTPSSTSGILSTLTTTERHVAADGTITEKTVLKKRFADGREETESSTTTTEADRVAVWPRYTEQDYARTNAPESKIAKEARRSGGWFWSS